MVLGNGILETHEYLIRFKDLDRGPQTNLRTAYLGVYIRARVIVALISRSLSVDWGNRYNFNRDDFKGRLI